MATLNLNGVDIPQFCRVLNIQYPVLPSVENNLVSVPGKKGLYLMNQEMNKREIQATIMIIAEDKNDVVDKARTLASWLATDTPIPLVIEDEPDKYYMVVPSGDSNITETLFTGQVQITFVCTEVYAYGKDQSMTVTPTADQTVDVEVGGTAPTYPQIQLTLSQDTQSISVVGSDSYVVIGDPSDVTITPINTKPLALHVNSGDAVTGWTTPTSIDNGTIAGSLDSNGWSLNVKGNDFGTGSAWHGPSAIQSLTTPIQDFEIDIDVYTQIQSKAQVCKIEVYALDANNNQIGKISIGDLYSSYDNVNFAARAGIAAGGNTFINTTRNDVWKNMYPGTLKLGRNGTTWYAYIGNKNSKGLYDEALYKEFNSANIPYASNKLAKIQVAILAWGTSAVPSRWAIGTLNVYQLITPTASQAPLIGSNGDVILIDNETMTIYKNGEPRWDLLNPVSNPIKFTPGSNGLLLSPSSASMQINWTERWL